MTPRSFDDECFHRFRQTVHAEIALDHLEGCLRAETVEQYVSRSNLDLRQFLGAGSRNGARGDDKQRPGQAMYRITQEALQNVVKHSGADAARVELWEDEDAIILRISDTGSGFEPGSPQGGGFGLVSMRERLRLVDSQLTIESSPGTGTRLEIRVPTTPADAG